MSEGREGHTQSGLIACGAYGDSFEDRRCINFQSGSWVTLTDKLVHERWDHSSWTTPDGGILLIGGGSKYSENNTEIVYQNGSSISSFDLKYSTT